MRATDEPAPARATRGAYGRVALLAGAIAVLALLGRRFGDEVPRLAEEVARLGAWGPVVFVLAYALATVALAPGSLLTLAAGAVFGLVWGTVYAFLAATLGASLAFLVARHLARSAVARRLERHPRFAAVDRAIAREGRRIVLLLRLSPVFPFNFLNYALGLTGVRFADYVAASVGMLPGTLLYVYYGKLAGDLAALAGGAGAPRDTGYYVVTTLGLLATVGATALVARAARRALREATREEEARDDQ